LPALGSVQSATLDIDFAGNGTYGLVNLTVTGIFLGKPFSFTMPRDSTGAVTPGLLYPSSSFRGGGFEGILGGAAYNRAGLRVIVPIGGVNLEAALLLNRN
jgi:hypothetical protein